MSRSKLPTGSVSRMVTFAAALLLLHPLQTAADSTGRDLNWSLGYELPDNKCKSPKVRKTNQLANQSEKMRRKINRYNNCVRKYQTGLFEDAKRIQDSVAVGVSPEQAEVLKTKLLAIATRIKQGADGGALDMVDRLEMERLFSQGTRAGI